MSYSSNNIPIAFKSSSGKKHRLSYFDLGGRAEPIRICLFAAGIEFEDHRITEWPSSKAETPLGSVPVLEIDGIAHCQSMALARYAAKQAGFYPTDPLEALCVDEVMDTCNEIQASLPANAMENKSLQLEWQAQTLTKYAALLESRIQTSGGNSVAREASVADMVVFVLVENAKSGLFSFIDKDFFDSYPGVMATHAAIRRHPKVQAYYDSLNVK